MDDRVRIRNMWTNSGCTTINNGLREVPPVTKNVYCKMYHVEGGKRKAVGVDKRRV
jgi:hypothetical protein